MRFSDLDLRAVYRSGTSGIIKDFYIPALKCANQYDRAVGYFGSIAFAEAAEGLSAFLENDGKIRMVIGAPLTPEEELRVVHGYKDRTVCESKEVLERIERELLFLLNADLGELRNRRLDVLALLIQTGRLNLKVAIQPRGMFHEKIGIMKSESGEIIVFQGSSNETGAALLPGMNRESINVFKSWKHGDEHITPHIEFFEQLWNDHVEGVVVRDFPTVVQDQLMKRPAKQFRPEDEIHLSEKIVLTLKERSTSPALPEGHRLRDHQRDALRAWIDAGYRGVLSMATGSGKTITAIHMATKVFESRKRIALIVSVPYIPLAEQWCDELNRFSFLPIKCYGSEANWGKELSAQAINYTSGFSNVFCAVVVNRTLQSTKFQQVLNRMRMADEVMFIGDECHNQGAYGVSKALPDFAAYKMGLSATFERHGDEEGTQRLIDYYGSVVYEYSLDRAITEGVLCEYTYQVTPVPLTASEAEQYLVLSEEIRRIVGQNKDAMQVENSSNQRIKLLMFQRARLLGRAVNKVHALRKHIEENGLEPFTLIYCGEGNIDIDDTGIISEPGDYDHVDLVSKVVADFGYSVARFTSEESKEEQKFTLDRFKAGELEAITAIKCLDEGIDVPATRTAFILASTRNPRQHVQRRGRVLRRAPNKDFAAIYDYLAVLPNELVQDNKLEKALLQAELKRVMEFSQLSNNPSSSLDQIRALADSYEILL